MPSSKKAQIAHIKADKAFTKVFSKYTGFADVFKSKLAIELIKYKNQQLYHQVSK